jgi:predicted HTH transcriptional regulator
MLRPTRVNVSKPVKAIDLRRRWAVSEKTAKRDIAALKKSDLIEFFGSFKTGTYRLAR